MVKVPYRWMMHKIQWRQWLIHKKILPKTQCLTFFHYQQIQSVQIKSHSTIYSFQRSNHAADNINMHQLFTMIFKTTRLRSCNANENFFRKGNFLPSHNKHGSWSLIFVNFQNQGNTKLYLILCEKLSHGVIKPLFFLQNKTGFCFVMQMTKHSIMLSQVTIFYFKSKLTFILSACPIYVGFKPTLMYHN